MCGIFGSFEWNEYKRLYDKNKERGNFSYGCLYSDLGGHHGIIKKEGVINLATHGKFSILETCKLFLGHTQAPTSSERSWATETSHPFKHGYWVVAHNGVLENHNELNDKYHFENVNPVDSSVIPLLLNFHGYTDEIKSISKTFSEITGTFGCWIYNTETHNTYLVRAGSTLFGNELTSTFSSVKTKNCAKALDEGVIYQVTDEGLIKVGGFSSHSPFFIC